jgi:protein-S-isoprenylcysteine O-methyltransferase Ste14
MKRPAGQQSAADSIPSSASSFGWNIVGLFAGLMVIIAMARGNDGGGSGERYGPLLSCLAIFTVIAAAEWLLRRRRRLTASQIAGASLRPLDLQRVALRELGFAATIALVAFAYWLFPEYHGSFYDPFWRFLKSLAYPAILIPFYLLWVDRHAENPRDEFVEFGLLVLGRRREVDPVVIKQHLLGWTVKGFFLPLMTVYLNNEFNTFTNLYRTSGFNAFASYDFWFHLSYTIDLLFCVIGYTAASRLFDSHIRSVETTMTGWVVALICYQPFYSVIGRFYLQYEGDIFWDNWLLPWPRLRAMWAVAIVTLVMIYSLSTVAFGLRFSNLTHRGIITSGPYRFTKHPAYLSKNLSWWLISVPFVAINDAAGALRHCALLLALNAVYFIRARTEERHLSADPVYVAYARWIDEHGMLSRLGRIAPWLRYRGPAPAAGLLTTPGASRAS